VAGFAGQQPSRRAFQWGHLSVLLRRPGRQESLPLTTILTAAVAANRRRLGNRPSKRDGLGGASGVNQQGSVSVSVSVSGENSRDQTPTVECGFLRQPIVDSG
jgi:hypothetical protein